MSIRSAEKSPSSEPRGATTFSCGARVTTQALPAAVRSAQTSNADSDRRQHDQQRRAAAEPPGVAPAATRRRRGGRARRRGLVFVGHAQGAENVMPTLMCRRQSFTASP